MKMYFMFGSTIAFLASLFACTKTKSYWSIMARRVKLAFKFQMVGISGNINDLVNAKHNRTDLPTKTGCVAIVTGGSRGIGAVVVKMLLECDMDVVIACRKVEAGQRTIEDIRNSGVTTGNAKVYQLDNASFKSVRKFADEIKKDYDKVNVLINNAGVMFPPYAETEDGFEQQWAINHLAHFLLTSLLMPLLCNAGSAKNFARVVNISSCAHLLGEIDFDDINNKSVYLPNAAYAQSKLAQVMFTRWLEEEAKKNNLPIHSYCVHPGIVDTELFEHSYIRHLTLLRSLLFKTPKQGATTIVYAAVSDKIENTGGTYLSNCLEMPVNPLADDKAVRDKMIALSLEQTKLDNFLKYLKNTQ